MKPKEHDHALERKKSPVAIDRTECSIPCTTERINEESCRLASTVSQETASTTTSGNPKHAFSSPLHPESAINREHKYDSESKESPLKSCVISILSVKPCGMTQLKKKLLDTKGVSVVGCRGSGAKQERGVRYVNQEELSVLLKQICVYKPPGMYVLREEYYRDPATSCIAHPSQGRYSMDGLVSGLEFEVRGEWSRDIETEEDYRLYCAEYEERYAAAFRIHQQLRRMQTAQEESQKNALYITYTQVRAHLECIKEHIERYQEKIALL